MTAYFFDTSALIKRYVTESGSAWVLSATRRSSGNQIFVATITPIEIVSGIMRRKREGTITAATASAARRIVDRHTQQEYQVVRLTALIASHAEDLLETHSLRAMDSIQLASALILETRLRAIGISTTFVSADIRLNSVAGAEGLTIHIPT